MSIIRINRQPSRRQLAVFGLLWLAFFGAAAWFSWTRGGPLPLAVALGAVAVLTPAAGLVAPGWLRLVYLGSCYLTFPIGFCVSHVVLAVLFYLVITPIGLVMRAAGHDPMERRSDPGAASYWIARPADGRIDRYFRQY